MVFLEDVLKKEEITNNLRYFTQYWEYYCKTIEYPSLYNTIMTPHYLVKEIIDELKTNGVNNTNTFSYFYSQVTAFLKFKLLFTDETYSLWNLLHTKLTEKEKQIIVISSLAEKLDNFFNSENYKRIIFDNLQKNLNSKKDEFENIKKLTETIIFEFIFGGFSITTVNELITKIFSFYSIEDLGDGKPNFYTNYPLITKYNENDYENYVSSAKKEIETLTLQNRLDRLYSLLVANEEQYFYIFYLEGIVLEESQTFGDITFYNPNKQAMITDSSRFENDVFNGANYEIGMNVIISQKAKEILSGKQSAIKKLEKVCDLIKLLDNPKSDFYLNTSYYKVLDENRKFYNGTMGFTKKRVSPYDVIRSNNVITNAQDLFKNIYLNNEISDHDKDIFMDSLHFYRKAKESNNLEETIVLFDLLNGIKNKKNLKTVAMDFYIKAEQDIYLAEKDLTYLFIKKLEE